ncbi:MAG TPA: hypothetical protein VGI36_21555 [Candidatus Binataceae bacterium]
MVDQKLQDRLLDQGLNCHAAQDGGKLQLPVFRLGYTCAKLSLGFSRLAGGQDGTGSDRGAVYGRIRAGFEAAAMVSLITC